MTAMLTVDGTATQHIAGPMEDWVQVCTRCGCVLSDYRNCAWPEGDKAPAGWPVGEVYKFGNMTTTFPLDPSVPCVPVVLS